MKKLFAILFCFALVSVVVSQPPDPYLADKAIIESLFTPEVTIDVNLIQSPVYAAVPVPGISSLTAVTCSARSGPNAVLTNITEVPYFNYTDVQYNSHYNYEYLCNQVNSINYLAPDAPLKVPWQYQTE